VLKQSDPDHISGNRRLLQEALLVTREAVQARRDQSADRRGYVLDLLWTLHAPPTSLFRDRAGLDEHAHALLEEQRVASGPLHQAEGQFGGEIRAEDLSSEHARVTFVQGGELQDGKRASESFGSRKPKDEDRSAPG
jgi:hypothetical protein